MRFRRAGREESIHKKGAMMRVGVNVLEVSDLGANKVQKFRGRGLEGGERKRAENKSER